MMTRIAMGLLVGALFFVSPGISLADGDTHALEELMVHMADSPNEHMALADYYHGKAEEARKTVAMHKAMGSAYVGGRISQGQRMQRHCESLAKKYSDIADEYDALAKLHEEEAKKSK